MARAAQNAFRHGLNVPVLSDPLLAPKIAAMGHRISGLYADAQTVERARRIAEAQFDLNRVRSSRRLLITQFLIDPNFLPRHVDRQRLRLLHLALGARFRGPPIEVQKIKEIFSPMPPEREEKRAIILRQRVRSLPRLIDTSDALCRDAKPRSAVLTRLERSPSRSNRTKFNVT
jgi:hypothetical protein